MPKLTNRGTLYTFSVYGQSGRPQRDWNQSFCHACCRRNGDAPSPQRLALLLLGGLLCAAWAQSDAPDWPGTKPIRFEVVAAPGGLVDIVPRTLSNPLAASIGVPVVVENRPGAGGNVAAVVVARAEPDGHTLLVTGSNLVVNQTLLPNPGFDYERDLAPVSMVVTSKLLLVASPSFPANSITDVIALAKQKPKSVSIAISPIGTPNHLAAEMLAQFGGVDLNFVAYNGIAQAMPDLIAGRVDLAVAAISVLLPQVRSGALKALAVTSPQRYPLAPDIPTAAEAGMRGAADRRLDLRDDHRRHACAHRRAPRRGNRQSFGRCRRSAMRSPSRASRSRT